MKFATIPGSAYWASLFINGDGSGLESKERELAYMWLERNDVLNVVDVEGEPHFSWHYGFHTLDDVRGGDLLDYVCEVKDV